MSAPLEGQSEGQRLDVLLQLLNEREKEGGALSTFINVVRLQSLLCTLAASRLTLSGN